jgi:hypothetical protein
VVSRATAGSVFGRFLCMVVLALVASCGAAPRGAPVSPGNSVAAQASPSTTYHLGIEWSRVYTSLSSLKKDSDMAVVGSIAALLARPPATAKAGLPSSVYLLQISQALYDPHDLAMSSLHLYQNGGTIDGQLIPADGDPLFQIGDHVILFLQHDGPGLYIVSGGPTGRFVIDNDGTVRGIYPAGVILPSGTTVSAFSSMVKNA